MQFNKNKPTFLCVFIQVIFFALQARDNIWCVYGRGGQEKKKNRGILISFIFIYGPEGSQRSRKSSGEEEYYTEGLSEVRQNLQS